MKPIRTLVCYLLLDIKWLKWNKIWLCHFWWLTVSSTNSSLLPYCFIIVSFVLFGIAGPYCLIERSSLPGVVPPISPLPFIYRLTPSCSHVRLTWLTFHISYFLWWWGICWHFLQTLLLLWIRNRFQAPALSELSCIEREGKKLNGKNFGI